VNHLSGLALNHNPPDLDFQIARIINMSHGHLDSDSILSILG
jgi:hypothetical protein